jgi:hypothetical protein
LLFLYAEKEPIKNERAALRWLARYVTEGKAVSLLKAQLAASATRVPLAASRPREGRATPAPLTQHGDSYKSGGTFPTPYGTSAFTRARGGRHPRHPPEREREVVPRASCPGTNLYRALGGARGR